MAGTSNITGLESITFTDNASFDGTERGGAMTTNGQLWIGSTVGRHVKLGQLTSPSGTLSIGYSSPDITLDLAGGSIGIDSVAVQTGTSPVVPTVAGLLTINGAVVAAGTNPVRSDGTGANTMAIEVQISQAVAATDATKIGLANFNSAQFTVDANGFVSTSGTGIPNTITGNTGGALSPTLGNWNIVTSNTTVTFAGSGSTLTEDFGLTNLMLGSSSTGITSAARNVGVGLTNLNPITSGTDNTAIGYNALKSVTTSSLNTAVGSFSQQTLSTGATGNTSIGYSSLQSNTGSFNTALGYGSLGNCVSGSSNCATGHGALGTITTGTYNIGIGPDSFNGSSLTHADSSNIMIGNAGTAGDNNKIRIGTQGSSSGKQNTCHIAGIAGVSVSNINAVTIDTTTGQLGSQAVTSGTVTNVSGTANQVAVANGTTTPVISLIGPYTPATYTAHGVLIGEGTSSIVATATGSAGQVLQSGGASADPTWSTATYPSTTTINQILYSSAANTISGLTPTNRSVLVGNSSGVPVWRPLNADGQVLIGSGSSQPTAATITAGAGISITNGANSITIASTGGGFTWTDVTSATQTIAVQNGYLTDRAGGVTYTLPATANIGDTFIIMGKLGITTITPNANQQLLMSSASGTVGVTGTVVGTNVGDCATFVCTTSGSSTVWRSQNFVGNWTIN